MRKFLSLNERRYWFAQEMEENKAEEDGNGGGGGGGKNRLLSKTKTNYEHFQIRCMVTK